MASTAPSSGFRCNRIVWQSPQHSSQLVWHDWYLRPVCHDTSWIAKLPQLLLYPPISPRIAGSDSGVIFTYLTLRNGSHWISNYECRRMITFSLVDLIKYLFYWSFPTHLLLTDFKHGSINIANISHLVSPCKMALGHIQYQHLHGVTFDGLHCINTWTLVLSIENQVTR